MNFTAPAFVLGFPLVLTLHWRLPPKMRWVLLLAASLGFYALGSPRAFPLLLAVTAGTYLLARGIAHSQNTALRKLLLLAAVCLCLGILGVFKYAGFFGAGVSLLLPAGISFYTFQTLGYVIDVYRQKTPAEKHLGYYALFVSFFPQLVAGPIERSGDLLPQLHSTTRQRDAFGWVWMLRGFAKKLLLADTAARLVDAVYADPAAATGPSAVLATVLFAWQIYWDFSGYSDIAIGAAALLGVKLTPNFNHPYRAESLQDFWHRWHITLNRWLTEYVYIPLGGSRCGAVRHVLNLLLVFLASGLWHGAAWHFVVWGGVHGVLLAGETCLNRGSKQHKLPPWTHRILTFCLVCVAWVFFRAGSVADAVTLFTRLSVGWSPDGLLQPLTALGTGAAARLLLGAACLHLLPEQKPQALRPADVLALFLLALAVAAAWLAALRGGAANAFLYFQF